MDEARLCGPSFHTGPIALPALGGGYLGLKKPAWCWWDSNPRPSDPQSEALSATGAGNTDVHVKLDLE